VYYKRDIYPVYLIRSYTNYQFDALIIIYS